MTYEDLIHKYHLQEDEPTGKDTPSEETEADEDDTDEDDETDEEVI